MAAVRASVGVFVAVAFLATAFAALVQPNSVGGSGVALRLGDRIYEDGSVPTDSPEPVILESTWDECVCPEWTGPSCLCVMYYLCDPKTYTISTDGREVLVDRFGEPDKLDVCPGFSQVCCGTPKNITHNSTLVIVPTATTPAAPAEGSSTSQPPPPDTPSGSSEGPPLTGEKISPPSRWECGIRRTDFQVLDSLSRIDNRTADEVAFAEFPWMLVMLRESSSQWLGGASLVRPDVALTAAHSALKSPEDDIVVRAGEWDTWKTDEPRPHQDRPVARIVVHPNYVERALHYDAALVFLKSPFEASLHIAPICLPPPAPSAEELLAVGGARAGARRCLATGWGAEHAGEKELRNLLRRVDLPVVPRDECQQRLRKTRLGIFFILNESFLCAGGEDGLDTCKGDGGGPLVCQSLTDPRRYEQLGIVSWGLDCAEGGVPGVYTDVTRLRSWLDEQLANNTF